MILDLMTKDRLLLLQILPANGNILTLKIMRDLRESIGFKEEESKEIELVSDPQTGHTTWNVEKDKPQPFGFGEAITKVVKDMLNKMNDAEQLTDAHVELYDMFFN